MKYIDTEKLKVLVKRQIRWENLNFAALGGGGQTFCINTLEWVLKQIDSLQQEQPDVDIREEIKKLEFMGSNDARDILHVAEHFYELGKNSK